MSIRHRLLAATTLLIVSLSLVFTAIICVKERQALLRELDEKLHLAVSLASESVPDDYHDRIVDQTSVSAEDYARIVDKNDKLCREYGLQYLWSCMKVGDRILFTTSTSPTKEVQKGDYAPFFSVHRDAHAFAKVFKTMKTDYSSFHNEWGNGRMVLVPARDRKGRRYCFGASISFDEVNKALKETFIHALTLCGWILAAGLAGSIALSTKLSQPIIRLTKAANSIAYGDMDQVIETGGSSELQSLGKSIAFMRDSIHKTIAELKSEIAERQGVEERLREAKTRYRVLFQESPDGIVIIDPETARFVEFNESAHRQLGYSHTEFSQLSIFDIEASETMEETRAKIAKVLREGNYDFDTQMRTRTGEIKHVHITAQIISALQHPIYHCIWRDITERKQTETMLRKSEQRYHSLFENMLEGVAYCRMIFNDADQPQDWIYLSVNNAFERLTGLKNVFGKTNTEVIPGIRESHPELLEIYGRVALTGQPAKFESYLEPLGAWLTISVYGPERGYFVTILDNITERKRAELELQRVNRALLILKECNAAVIRASSEPELLNNVCHILMNIWGAQMTWIGFTKDDAKKNVHVVAGSDPDYMERLDITWAEEPRGRGPAGTAIRTQKVSICRDIPSDPCFAAKGGRAIKEGYLSMIALPLIFNHRCLGVLAIYSNRTDAFNDEEVELLEQLTSDLAYGIISLRTRAEHEQLQEELLRSSEHAKQLIAQELHDGLCQNLAGTSFMSSILHSRLAASKIPDAKLAREICNLLSTAVNEARNLSHGLHPVGPEGEGLMNALSKLAGNVRKLFHIHCTFRCPEPVFFENESASTHLFRITQEAINNARKHGEADRVTISLNKTPDGLTLVIRDNGIGLPAEMPKKSGMGLRIMKHRASQIGASISVRRAGKNGTEVTCTLPIPTPRHTEPVNKRSWLATKTSGKNQG